MTKDKIFEKIGLKAEIKEEKKPDCQHFYECGGCALQHLSEQSYYVTKQNIFQNAVEKAGFDKDKFSEVIRIGPRTRRRANLKVNFNNGQCEIGFYRAETHEVVDMQECHILMPEIFKLVQPLRALLVSISQPEMVKQLLVTVTDYGADILIYADAKLEINDAEKLTEFAGKNNVARISWKWGEQIKPVIVRKKPEVKFDGMVVEIPDESFLQPTIEGQNILIGEVIAALKKQKKIIDLFSGCGTYSLPLARTAKVHAVEIGGDMVNLLQKAAAGNNLSGKVTTEKRDLMKNPVQVQELDNYDGIVINPPRDGAFKQCKNIAGSRVKKLVMVSCNPDTFARDAKILKEGGYKLKKAVAVDQFYWNPHLEIVAVFEK